MSDLFGASDGEVMKSATLSECHAYRYTLDRWWSANRPWVLFIMLNPSTADAEIDDRTIKRCIGFARTWGFGGLRVANLFAFRATDPDVMKAASDPIGPENDRIITDCCVSASRIVCAWGTDGAFMDRGNQVRHMIEHLYPIYHLGLTKHGHPKHPLYLRGDVRPVLWSC